MDGRTDVGKALDRRRALVRTFEAICRSGPISRAGLRVAIGASASTITTSVHELRARGFVSESGTGTSTGGRRPKFLDLATELGGVLAADIGGINVRAAAADLRGRLVGRVTAPTPRSTDPEYLRRTLQTALDSVRGDVLGPVRAVAVAVAGVVDPRTRAVSFAVNIPGWRDVSLEDWLSDFDAPVFVENEANLAAVGEHTTGGARAAQNVLFIAIGAGIGAGLILNGELFGGSTGAAGEIGYLRTSVQEPPAELEREAGADALVRRYRERGGKTVDSSPEVVFARAAAGEPAATEAVGEVLDHLAVGVSNAIALFNPELVVLGGGLAQAGEALLAPLENRVAALVPVMPKIVLSELGSDAALVGAAWLAGQQARSSLAVELARVPELV